MRQRRLLTLAVPEPKSAFQPPLMFEIGSSDGHTVYIVTKLASGEWTCDSRCQGFKYRETCRHVTKARVLAGEVVDIKIPEDLL